MRLFYSSLRSRLGLPAFTSLGETAEPASVTLTLPDGRAVEVMFPAGTPVGLQDSRVIIGTYRTEPRS